MKNDEILISVSFKKKESETIKERLMSFLVKKDITLKNLIQGIYYGLKKRKKNIEKGQIEYTEKFELSDIECFDLFETFIKTHKQLIILYTIKGENKNKGENKKIDFSSIRKEVPSPKGTGAAGPFSFSGISRHSVPFAGDQRFMFLSS